MAISATPAAATPTTVRTAVLDLLRAFGMTTIDRKSVV